MLVLYYLKQSMCATAQSAYHLQSLNQMFELSETYSCLHNLHPVRELDADEDLLVDVGHPVSGILKGCLTRSCTLLSSLTFLLLTGSPPLHQWAFPEQ